jgi:CheY-like chemotaxis protein
VTAEVKGGHEVVLVVEDNDMMRRVVMRQLSSLGYRALEADNAVAALAVLKSTAVDLMLTDIVMPGGMNGADLARAATALVPQLKILFTSGFPDAHVESSGWIGDNHRLLSKPYRREELALALRVALAD